MTTNFEDVQFFHRKFDVGTPDSHPHLIPEDVWHFRQKFLHQELAEIEEAYEQKDLAKFFDGLIDLVYVLLGTADLASLPWQAGWDEVQRANLEKQRAASAEQSQQLTGRGHHLDVIKPPGWTPPDIAGILDSYKRFP